MSQKPLSPICGCPGVSTAAQREEELRKKREGSTRPTLQPTAPLAHHTCCPAPQQGQTHPMLLGGGGNFLGALEFFGGEIP